MLFFISCEKDPLKCNIKTHKRNMKIIFANYLKKYAQVQVIASTTQNFQWYLKTLDKRTFKKYIRSEDSWVFTPSSPLVLRPYSFSSIFQHFLLKKRAYTHARTPLLPVRFCSLFNNPPLPLPSSTNVLFEWHLKQLD